MTGLIAVLRTGAMIISVYVSDGNRVVIIFMAVISKMILILNRCCHRHKFSKCQ